MSEKIKIKLVEFQDTESYRLIIDGISEDLSFKIEDIDDLLKEYRYGYSKNVFKRLEVIGCVNTSQDSELYINLIKLIAVNISNKCNYTITGCDIPISIVVDLVNVNESYILSPIKDCEKNFILFLSKIDYDTNTISYIDIGNNTIYELKVYDATKSDIFLWLDSDAIDGILDNLTIRLRDIFINKSTAYTKVVKTLRQLNCQVDDHIIELYADDENNGLYTADYSIPIHMNKALARFSSSELIALSNYLEMIYKDTHDINWDNVQGFSSLIDEFGMIYTPKKFIKQHNLIPERIMDIFYKLFGCPGELNKDEFFNKFWEL